MADRHGLMTCPVDRTILTMSERQGIEIDYCPSVMGVRLDPGELDEILEKNAAAPAPQASYEQPFIPSRDSRDYDRGYGHDGSSHDYSHKGRRKSFLSELCD